MMDNEYRDFVITKTKQYLQSISTQKDTFTDCHFTSIENDGECTSIFVSLEDFAKKINSSCSVKIPLNVKRNQFVMITCNKTNFIWELAEFQGPSITFKEKTEHVLNNNEICVSWKPSITFKDK